ncbi:Uncharacterized protein APZ42_030074, partial [Daphnia magna]
SRCVCVCVCVCVGVGVGDGEKENKTKKATKKPNHYTARPLTNTLLQLVSFWVCVCVCTQTETDDCVGGKRRRMPCQNRKQTEPISSARLSAYLDIFIWNASTHVCLDSLYKQAAGNFMSSSTIPKYIRNALANIAVFFFNFLIEEKRK